MRHAAMDPGEPDQPVAMRRLSKRAHPSTLARPRAQRAQMASEPGRAVPDAVTRVAPATERARPSSAPGFALLRFGRASGGGSLQGSASLGATVAVEPKLPLG